MLPRMTHRRKRREPFDALPQAVLGTLAE